MFADHWRNQDARFLTGRSRVNIRQEMILGHSRARTI